MLDFLMDFGSILHIANNCKQDFTNWKFFKKQDGKLSSHFYKLAEDYFRLLMLDLHIIFSKSDKDRGSLRQLFSKLLSNKYPDSKIPEDEILRWTAILDQHDATIEKIRMLKEQKIDHAPCNDTFISTWDIQKLVVMMEIIIIQICHKEDFGLPGIPTIDEKYQHNIAEAFRRVEQAKQYRELSKQFSINKNGASVMQKVI